MLSNKLVNAQEKIKFDISFTEPQAHYIEVKMRIDGNTAEFIDLKMPVWSPGSYLIREYPKNVEGFRASSNGKSLKAEKTDKNTWRIKTEAAKSIEVNYRVYAFEVSVRTSLVDASHAFLSPTGTFMYIKDKINLPSEVTIHPYEGWSKISTGLEPVNGKTNTFHAPNFDILFDAPFEIGNQEIFYFTAAGIEHEVAMVGEAYYNEAVLKRDIAKIIESETEIFKENPNKRYVFIIHNYESGRGGLEHLNSTVLAASRDSYNTRSSYIDFLGLVSHEYFHIWNIKRLRPENLGPFNYDAENYTTNLWISEGFTAYYDNLVLRKAAIVDEKEYLQILASDINGVENRPGNHVQSLKESSFDAWIKQYRPNENSMNTTVTYYNKGALVGLLLDLEILHITQAKSGLDEVMRAMYEQYYTKEDRGFTEAEFIAMAEKIAGKSLKHIFDYVEVASSLDYNRYLKHAGLELVDLNQDIQHTTLGINTSLENGRLIVSSVIAGTAAREYGINAKDELISINGTRVSSSQAIDKLMFDQKPGDKLEVLVSRDGLLKTLFVRTSADTRKQYMILPLQETSPAQDAVKNTWLGL